MANKELEADELVGTYRVVRKVGEGGMGEVYEAWDGNLNRSVAIKIMNSAASTDGEMIERFRSEGRVLARLRHPNVVALYAQGEHNGCPYMAMEFVEGMTVDEFLIHHPCSLTALVDFFRQMLEGVGAAHAAGIIHRDIKPQNIIVGQDLQVKIIDFGVAKDHADHLSLQTTLNMVVGTAHYFAPELVSGKMANAQTDLFSLGLVFHYMITGDRPFEGKGNLEILEKIRTTDVVLGSKVSSLLPEALRNVLVRLTQRNPALRFRSAKEALDELDAVDLNELPPDLCVAPSPRIFLANAAEVRRLCKDQQLSWFESRFVVNIAIEGQKTESPSADSTQPINLMPVVTLSDAAIMEGVRRYRLARSTMISRKTASQALYVEPIPRQKMSVGMPLLFVAILGLSAWAWMDYTAKPSSKVKIAIGEEWPPHKPSPTAKIPAKVPERKEASVETPTKAEDPGIPLPSLKLGTKFTVRTDALLENGSVSFSLRTEWVLDHVEDDVLSFRAPNGGVWDEQRNSIAPVLNYVSPGGEEVRKIQSVTNLIKGNPSEIYPLKVGNKTTFKVESAERPRKKETRYRHYTLNCEVLRMENLTVGAGRFDTAVIECKDQVEPKNYLLIHYSPRLQRWVRFETKMLNERNEFERHLVFEVVGFSLPR